MAAETTPPLCDAQKSWGGHPPCVQARLLPPSGDCGSVASCHRAMVERMEGRRPQNRPRGAGRLTQNSRAGNPKRKRPKLPLVTKRYSQISVGSVCAQGAGAEEPSAQKGGAQGPQWKIRANSLPCWAAQSECSCDYSSSGTRFACVPIS